jgi:hypothetical protein
VRWSVKGRGREALGIGVGRGCVAWHECEDSRMGDRGRGPGGSQRLSLKERRRLRNGGEEDGGDAYGTACSWETMDKVERQRVGERQEERTRRIGRIDKAYLARAEVAKAVDGKRRRRLWRGKCPMTDRNACTAGPAGLQLRMCCIHV